MHPIDPELLLALHVEELRRDAAMVPASPREPEHVRPVPHIASRTVGHALIRAGRWLAGEAAMPAALG